MNKEARVRAKAASFQSFANEFGLIGRLEADLSLVQYIGGEFQLHKGGWAMTQRRYTTTQVATQIAKAGSFSLSPVQPRD